MRTDRCHRVSLFSAALACLLAVSLAVPVTALAQSRSEESASTTTNYTGAATITYTGKWHTTEITRNWSGGTAAVSIWGPSGSPSPSDPNVPAARATLAFTGTGVKWIGVRGPQTGIANVYLDGNFVESVDTFANNPPEHPEQIQPVLFSRSGLADGPHTLAIEVTGTKNASSGGYFIVVDAFDIEGNPSGRIQEAGPAAVTYFGTWILGDNAGHDWSGGTAAYSYAEGAPGIVPASTPEGGGDMRVTTRAIFTFSGTGVTWIGNLHPQGGVANVYVDGQFRQQVDVWAGVEQSQQTLFTSGPLTPGIHTLAIEVTGTKSSNSNCDPATAVPSCFIVPVDAFDVTP